MRLAVGLRLHDRHELAGNEVERINPLDRELEVLGLLRKKYRAHQPGSQEPALRRWRWRRQEVISLVWKGHTYWMRDS